MRASFALFAFTLCACEAVPDVVYDEGGSGSDAASDANTCPGVVPPYASVCCGAVACFGANCVATCSDCLARCAVGELCCPTSQDRAVCHTGPPTCP